MELTGSGVINVVFRAERKKDRICSDTQYRKTFQRLSQLPRTVEHLIVQLGTPALSISTVLVNYEQLEQGSPLRTLEWFSWRTHLSQSLTPWSTLEGRDLLAFLDLSISSMPRQNCWMIW